MALLHWLNKINARNHLGLTTKRESVCSNICPVLYFFSFGTDVPLQELWGLESHTPSQSCWQRAPRWEPQWLSPLWLRVPLTSSMGQSFWRTLWLLCPPSRRCCLVPQRGPGSLFKHTHVKQRNSRVFPLAVSLYSWLRKRTCRMFLGIFLALTRVSWWAPLSSSAISLPTQQKRGTHIGAAKSAMLHLVMTPIQLCSAQILTLKLHFK